MSKFFHHDGEVFVILKPAPWLLNSRTIKGIYNRGDTFVANLNTGELLVWKNKQKVEPRLYYQPDHRKSVRLSDDLSVAIIQIKDQFALGNIYGKLWYTNKEGIRSWIHSEGKLESFLENIKRAL